MISRRILVGALALGVALTACGKEAAGPAVDLSNTGAIQVLVLTDETNAATPNYVVRTGIPVLIYRDGDTTLVRRQNSNAQGKAVFRGLPPGRYIVKVGARDFTVFSGNQFSVVTVAAHDVDSSTTFRFRQGGRITGFIAAQYIQGDSGVVTKRFPAGKIVRLLSGTTVVAEDTTDAGGNYEFVAPIFTQQLSIRFQSGVTTIYPDLVLSTDTLQKITDSVVVFRGSASGLTGASITQNILFNFTSYIAGRVFRDYNSNGTYDGAAENLILGDTVQVQLRNEAGDKVLSTVRVLSNTAFVQAPVSITPAYSFRSLRAGTYKLLIAKSISRFFAQPSFNPVVDTITVTLGTNQDKVIKDLPLKPTP